MNPENYESHPQGAWPRTVTISLEEEMRVSIRNAAKESEMTVSGYLASLIKFQNPEGLPIFRKVIKYTIDQK